MIRSYSKTLWAAFLVFGLGTVAIQSGCGEHTPSYSILPAAQQFVQDAEPVNAKVDILWVIDNSGSMATSQANLVNNFEAFIKDFVDNEYDFQMAVTTTDAYRAKPPFNGGSWNYNRSDFRDGANGNFSGVRIITPETPDIVETFVTNATQGIWGHGDERPFESIVTTLDLTPATEGFLRGDAFLAIIILTDEDDFSHDGSNWARDDYNYPGLHSIGQYIDFLDQYTGSSGDSRRYNVNSISILDQECLDEVSYGVQKIGHRVHELVDETGGIKGSLCGDFRVILGSMSQLILQLSTQFYLDREPVVSSIRVSINGEVVPHVDENPGPKKGGWSYNASANSILFHGDYLPPQGAVISVNFDPTSMIF